MAVTATPISSTISLKVEVGTTASGATKYGSRSISYINPSLSNENALDAGEAIGALQTHTVAGITRTNKVDLVRE